MARFAAGMEHQVSGIRAGTNSSAVSILAAKMRKLVALSAVGMEEGGSASGASFPVNQFRTGSNEAVILIVMLEIAEQHIEDWNTFRHPRSGHILIGG
jgi:hypothetical protein